MGRYFLRSLNRKANHSYWKSDKFRYWKGPGTELFPGSYVWLGYVIGAIKKEIKNEKIHTS